MPSKRPHPCNMRGCHKLTTTYYCTDHGTNKPDNERASASKRGYGTRWERERKYFILKHPFCAACNKKKIITLGTEVDHVVPHKGDMILFWNQDNWQTLCHSCHSRKTAAEDMGQWDTHGGIK